MKKVKFKSAIGGLADGVHHKHDFIYQAGEVVEIPEALAKAWVASGIVEFAADDEKKSK